MMWASPPCVGSFRAVLPVATAALDHPTRLPTGRRRRCCTARAQPAAGPGLPSCPWPPPCPRMQGAAAAHIPEGEAGRAGPAAQAGRCLLVLFRWPKQGGHRLLGVCASGCVVPPCLPACPLTSLPRLPPALLPAARPSQARAQAAAGDGGGTGARVHAGEQCTCARLVGPCFAHARAREALRCPLLPGGQGNATPIGSPPQGPTPGMRHAPAALSIIQFASGAGDGRAADERGRGHHARDRAGPGKGALFCSTVYRVAAQGPWPCHKDRRSRGRRYRCEGAAPGALPLPRCSARLAAAPIQRCHRASHRCRAWPRPRCSAS